ncbi:precorrin-2 dehydrogenase/sirohydrochlorin ferrochelatase family protein [Natronogracilivirga saccharolytica]|uniref:precorrin-2 dehydrogenase n=1 Tax=Natronogracilivirga saccharolytica TaxID=2812953 RepID=A0A8J7RRM9_9BACT|nr:bifunctional precorrin-2 dehydrogenase/sirohydrochlorin ferrochelatase [Natronogracilivirga saccharolytica]MBP3192614.1 bifunctional precorrin-2 dehydrogenase/sirohydrochlorin ferrochelatase [Natronogracilivirga saccharolytica]
MSFYPVFLTRLHENKVVLLGGDEEAERKTAELISFGARVHVISSEITGQMQSWYEDGAFEWTPREYKFGDLEGAGFVVAAEYTNRVAAEAAQEAGKRNLLINVMDNIPLSNSAFGSVVCQGKLTVSFSTNGLAPALAVRLKERFQQELDDAYGEFLALSETIRPAIMETITDGEIRKKKWYDWVDSETITLLREGNREKALDVTESIWGSRIMLRSGLRKNKGFLGYLRDTFRDWLRLEKM